MSDDAVFTPGPWDCCEVRTSCGRAFRIGRGQMLEPGPKGGCIIYDDYGHGHNEREANARLIAAAPNLYEALKWFIDDIDGTHTVMLEFDANVERSRKALARARGETP